MNHGGNFIPAETIHGLIPAISVNQIDLSSAPAFAE
jgi:hypothetical protein